MVKFQFFASKIVVLEPISKELDRVDLIAWAVAVVSSYRPLVDIQTPQSSGSIPIA